VWEGIIAVMNIRTVHVEALKPDVWHVEALKPDVSKEKDLARRNI
jgi:hypothetical protein